MAQKSLLNRISHFFYLTGNWFVRLLRVIPGFRRLSVRNQQFAAVGFLVFITIVLGWVLYPYFSHRYNLSGLENPIELNLADYQKVQVLAAINEVYSFEGNTDQAVIGKITDVERLAKRYPFLKKARNGEYLVIMPDFVLVYDYENRQVMDVARVNMLDLKASED